MSRIFVPGRKALVVPGTDKRVLRRPDASGLIVPQLSGAPLSGAEIDYDELTIARQWREYSPDAPDEVRYFCYELIQQLPGASEPDHFYKAVRLIRLTRVPRYLQQRPTNETFRDVLAGLREQRVLFVNMIAKSPQLPLVFAYGVQGTGSTLAEAFAMADEAFAALTFSLDGSYQQLEYKPLSVAEGEHLARYQAEWRHIAMSRGRPMPEAGGIGAAGVLDGNRTDLQQANDAISSFVRGMGDKSFMLSLVTWPMAPEEMSLAWRNLGSKLSAVRSDQQGQRMVGVSMTVPMSLGTSLATGHGTTHGLTGSQSTGSSDGLSSSYSEGVSVSQSDGVSASHSDGSSASLAQGVSTTHSANVSDSQSASVTDSTGTSTSVGESLTHSQGLSASQGTSDSVSLGHSYSESNTQSMSESAGTSQGQSLSESNSASSNWSSSAGQSIAAGQTLTDNWSQNFGESLSQTWGVSAGHTTGESQGTSHQNSSNLGSGVPGLDMGMGETLGSSSGDNISNTNGQSASQTGGGSSGWGVGSSLGTSLTSSQNIGESQGGSLGQSVTGTNSVGSSHTLTAGQSLGVSQGQSSTQTAGVSSSVGQNVGLSSGVSLSQGASDGRSAGVSQGQSLSQGLSSGTSTTATQGVSSTDTTGVSRTSTQGASATSSSGASTGASTSQAISDAWMVAMSRQSGTTGNFGLAPGISASVSKATFDERKRALGDILESQLKRYQDGVEGGGMLYQLFLVTSDRETLVGASTLLKAAFWGPGGADKGRLVSPFHTILIDDAQEADRLLTHAAALTQYRKREQVVDIIEPHHYSSFVTMAEAAVLASPPTAESIGLMAQVDSMPLFAMPADRGDADLHLGHLISGERGRVTDQRFGLDLKKVVHVLVQGETNSGKTSTMCKLLEQAVGLEKEVVSVPTAQNPVVEVHKRRAGVLAFDWMENMRSLATIVPPDRFQLFSVKRPQLGALRWNALEIPHPDMDPRQWLSLQSDQLASSFGLGEMGRQLIADYIDRLYSANRLEPFTLRAEVVGDDGTLLRRGMWLPAVPREDLPAGAVQPDGLGGEVANVYTYPMLSRLVSLEHVAALVVAFVEELATPEGARAHGTSMRDRAQSLWRRIQPYAPGGQYTAMVAADPDLRTRECLGVSDLIDPDRGLVTVVETDGLSLGSRRVVLGSIMLAIYQYGLLGGKGAFDNGGRGPGTFLVLEEAHEIFGAEDEGEDGAGARMRSHLYESMFRRARATGLRMVAMTQNCADIPSAITSQTTTVIAHTTRDAADRSRLADLFSWDKSISGQVREIRYLGEMPVGHAIVRVPPHGSYLEAAPVHVLVEPPVAAAPTEEFLQSLAASRAARLGRGPRS